MTKKIRITEVTGFERSPSNFYVFTAMSTYVFFHTKDRNEAQKAADEIYGKGFYSIRTTDISTKGKSKYQILADINEYRKEDKE